MSVFPFFNSGRDKTRTSGGASSSDGYRESVGLWLDMYRGSQHALNYPRGIQSLNLAAMIASELARISTIEADIRAEGDNSGLVNSIFAPFLRRLRRSLEIACAGGGMAFKPEYRDGRITISCFDAAHIIPLKWSDDGEFTSMGFIYNAEEGGCSYTRVETHTLDGDGYRITNRAWRSDYAAVPPVIGDNIYMGESVPLDRVQKWSGIESISVPQGAARPLYSYLAMPLCCAFDVSSPIGASVYSRAVGLIREADLQFNRLLWEYEGGELAVDASEDLFKRTKSGLQLPAGKERLFRVNMLDSTLSGTGMSVFSPALRDDSYITGLDVILSRIEDVCGLSRGTVSSLSYTNRTATEIKDSKQRLYTTVCDIQKALSYTLSDLAAAVSETARIRGLCGASVPEMRVSFNDSIIEDAADERVRDLGEVGAGLMTRDEFRRKWNLKEQPV